jgi:hypothetical protein
MNSYHLARIGSLVAGGGIIWAVYSATQDVEISPQFLEAAWKNVFLQSGPLEICGIGILVWLLGKWRASVSH